MNHLKKWDLQMSWEKLGDANGEEEPKDPTESMKFWMFFKTWRRN